MKQLNRRTFLRGAGTAIGLPLLEAMAPIGKTAFAADASPTRIMAYYTPCGISMKDWYPTGFGKDYTLSRTLAPLAGVKDQILVLKALDGRGPMDSQGGGAHSSGTGAFITGVQVQKDAGQGGVSIDQIAAKELGGNTKIDCLVTGTENNTGGESGYNGVFLNNISFVNGNTARPKLTNPMDVFNRITAGFDPTQVNEAALRRQKGDLSVLDFVADDTAKLATQLGQADKIRMEEYLTNLRAIEASLGAQNFEGATCDAKNPVVGASRTAHIDALAQVQALAFECDVTRIQTFMLANGGTYATYGFLPGIGGSHHGISHSKNYDQIRTIDLWEMERFAFFLNLLKAKKDPSGKNLLETCAIYFGNEICDGDAHNCNDLPVILAGSANGYFRTGEHLDVTGVKYTNVLYSMLNAFGSKETKVGNSTGLFTEGMA
jgi:Protein of unknown function (DUF1552)